MLKLKIIAVLVVFIVLSTAIALVVVVQEQNQISSKPKVQNGAECNIYIRLPDYNLPNFYMDVDGTRYYNRSTTFYWSVGSTHTLTVPNDIKNPNRQYSFQPIGWRLALLGNSRANTIQVVVTNSSGFGVQIFYDEYYN